MFRMTRLTVSGPARLTEIGGSAHVVIDWQDLPRRNDALDLDRQPRSDRRRSGGQEPRRQCRSRGTPARIAPVPNRAAKPQRSWVPPGPVPPQSTSFFNLPQNFTTGALKCERTRGREG
jgi:hypothetical protein